MQEEHAHRQGLTQQLLYMETKRWKMAILTWIGIYPTITAVLWLVSPVLSSFPLPLKTLVLTLIVVPLMVFFILPQLIRIFGRWVRA